MFEHHRLMQILLLTFLTITAVGQAPCNANQCRILSETRTYCNPNSAPYACMSILPGATASSTKGCNASPNYWPSQGICPESCDMRSCSGSNPFPPRPPPSNNPCANRYCGHGQCRVQGSSSYCVCDAGYTGSSCDRPEPRDPCANRYCGHGQCRIGGSSAYCVCDAGYTGSNCDRAVPTDPCAFYDCGSNGRCRVQGTSAHCECFNGYTGPNCRDRKNPTPVPKVCTQNQLAQRDCGYPGISRIDCEVKGCCFGYQVGDMPCFYADGMAPQEPTKNCNIPLNERKECMAGHTRRECEIRNCCWNEQLDPNHQAPNCYSRKLEPWYIGRRELSTSEDDIDRLCSKSQCAVFEAVKSSCKPGSMYTCLTTLPGRLDTDPKGCDTDPLFWLKRGDCDEWCDSSSCEQAETQDMRRSISMSQTVSAPLLLRSSSTSSDSCNVQPNNWEGRRQCGDSSIDLCSCQRKGCCYDPNSMGPFCFYANAQDMHRSISMSETVSAPALLRSSSTSSDYSCNVQPNNWEGRRQCGDSFIDLYSCQRMGCCFDPNSLGPFCFYANGRAADNGPLVCNARPENRHQCDGTAAGVSEQECRSRGCCWDDSQNRYRFPECYARDLNPNPAPMQCYIPNELEREKCGEDNEPASVCAQRGCCYDSSSLSHFCYFSEGMGPASGNGQMDCNIYNYDRPQCGVSGVSEQDCHLQGCCYDSSLQRRGLHSCFYPRRGGVQLLMASSNAIAAPTSMCTTSQCDVLEKTRTYCNKDSAPYACISTLPGRDDTDVKGCNGSPSHWPDSGICPESCDMRSCDAESLTAELVSEPLLFQSSSTSSERCNVLPNNWIGRQQCGTDNIGVYECQTKGCCYDPISQGPYCFYPNGNAADNGAMVCNAFPENRSQCMGTQVGVTEQQCRKRGCCWDSQVKSGTPWCFNKKMEPTPAPMQCYIPNDLEKEKCGENDEPASECTLRGCCYDASSRSHRCYFSEGMGPKAGHPDDPGCEDLGCGCGMPAPSGCDNQCGSTKVDHGCGCGMPAPSGCDNQCGSTKVDHGCGCGQPTPSGCDKKCGSTKVDHGCGCGMPGPSGCDNQCGSTKVDEGCGCGKPCTPDKCNVLPNNWVGRQQCGWTGIDPFSCQRMSCCFDPHSFGPYCFYSNDNGIDNGAMICNARPENRHQCKGTEPGITEQNCRSRGCCWDNTQNRFRTPWCFNKERTRTPVQKKCYQNASQREKCGEDYESASVCTQRGCCYDKDSVSPFCFFSEGMGPGAGNGPMDCNVYTYDRSQCGVSGISEQDCRQQGCCYDGSVRARGISPCFYPKRGAQRLMASSHEINSEPQLLMATTSRKRDCFVEESRKNKCGDYTIDKTSCEALGCCFDIASKIPCFKTAGNSKPGPDREQCYFEVPGDKHQCGDVNIPRDDCIARDCCYDDNHYPSCYYAHGQEHISPTMKPTYYSPPSTSNDPTPCLDDNGVVPVPTGSCNVLPGYRHEVQCGEEDIQECACRKKGCCWDASLNRQDTPRCYYGSDTPSPFPPKPATTTSHPLPPVPTSKPDCESNAWIQKDGFYVQEGHGDSTECYPTLEEAKTQCVNAGDCGAIATQSNVCNGQYRVTHGGPTFVHYAHWASYDLRAWQRVCSQAADDNLPAYDLIHGAPETTTTTQKPDPEERLGEVQCCTLDNECTRRNPVHSGSNEDCISGNNDPLKFTLREAIDACARLGPIWGLCTREQTEAGICKGKGCQHDNALVWVLVDNREYAVGGPGYAYMHASMASDKCNVQPNNWSGRRQCGYTNIDVYSCQNMGCCFDPNSRGPYCFYSNGNAADNGPMVCNARPENRHQCDGTAPGISEQNCRLRGCCWDNTQNRYRFPECFAKEMNPYPAQMKCYIPDELKREKCGENYEPAATCTQRGCCYDSSSRGFSCYFSEGMGPASGNGQMDCNVYTYDRPQCGVSGVSEQDCKLQGCCYDSSLQRRGLHSCYYPQRGGVQLLMESSNALTAPTLMCTTSQCDVLEKTRTYCNKDSAPYVCISTLPGQHDTDVKGCNHSPSYWPNSGLCPESCDMRSCETNLMTTATPMCTPTQCGVLETTHTYCNKDSAPYVCISTLPGQRDTDVKGCNHSPSYWPNSGVCPESCDMRSCDAKLFTAATPMCTPKQCGVLETTHTYCNKDSAPYVCISTLPGQHDTDVKGCNHSPSYWPNSGVCPESCDMRSCDAKSLTVVNLQHGTEETAMTDDHYLVGHGWKIASIALASVLVCALIIICWFVYDVIAQRGVCYPKGLVESLIDHMDGPAANRERRDAQDANQFQSVPNASLGLGDPTKYQRSDREGRFGGL